MDSREKILIIDDDNLVCSSIANVARSLGYEPATAFTLREGLQAIQKDLYDVVFLDVHMPDGNGIEMLPQISQNDGRPEVIVITAYGDPESVEAALSRGAWDYLEKPFSKNDLAQLLKDVVLYHEGNKQPSLSVDFEKEGIIGKSARMKECLALLSKTLRSDANVLITGETGTGKELFARAIHNNSLRSDKNFMVVDCAALPPNLVESILFGHEKGSYTGADKTQQGLVLQAHKGSLFLDEVGELPLSVQKKFLRILQEKRFRPVGKATEVESDFRVISATNQSLDSLVELKRFRKDLLFRLQSVTIHLPALRERPEDIPELTNHYMQGLSRRYGMKPKRLSAAFRETIVQYSWPGNVRELIHALERALTVAHESSILVPKHLPNHIHVQVKQSTVAGKRNKPACVLDAKETLASLKEVRDEALGEIEKQYLKELMSRTKGHIETACRVSGLSRSRLYALLQKYKIT
ncbi:MAG TPA: sigma-54 dependent transcriptional regulator [Desulfomonilia bacterium]|nr:sigma-54 dependent transcriptional regulator [Desulfomonilia bacterium]